MPAPRAKAVPRMADDNFNLYEHFARQLRENPDRELLAADDGRSLSRLDVESLSSRMARALADAGVGRGDRVSVQVEKSPENLCLYLACLRSGFVYHPLNTAYRPAELDYFLTNAERERHQISKTRQPFADACGTRNPFEMQQII